MKHVASVVLSLAVIGVVSVGYAKPPAPAPAPPSSPAKPIKGAPVYYKASAAGSDAAPYANIADALLTCAPKFTLTLRATSTKAYCNLPTSETRSVPLVCPANAQLMTEDKIPASAKRFAKTDLCLLPGKPPEAAASYAFPVCGTDGTGGFPLTQRVGPDVCEKTLVNFVALPPGVPDRTGGTQIGLQEDRITAALVRCPDGSTMVVQDNGVYCKKN